MLRLTQPGDAEIKHLDGFGAAHVLNNNVIRLQIAMNYSLPVSGVNRLAGLAENFHRAAIVESFFIYQISQQMALHNFHHQVMQIVISDIEIRDLDGVLMIDAHGRAGFIAETVSETLYFYQVWVEHFYRHFLSHLEVSRAVHIGHSTTAQPVFDPVFPMEHSSDQGLGND